jgi:hypothetical protein
LVEIAINYDQIDVLDKGTVWRGGAVDAAIDASPFAGPLLVVCMDRGEDNDQFINHATVEAMLAVWIDDVPTGGLNDGVLTGLADVIVAWLNDGGNIYLHCHHGVSRASYIDIAVHCRAWESAPARRWPASRPSGRSPTRIPDSWPSSSAYGGD